MIVLYLVFAALLTMYYAYIMRRYHITWQALPIWSPTQFSPKTKVTILVPARNEAPNIQACINAILAQDYPHHLYEIIVIDDFSEDETAQIIQNYTDNRVRLIQLADYIKENETTSFKKKGISIAVDAANGDLIVCTDADCIMGNKWLSLLVSYYEKTDTKFIAAPVVFHKEENLLGRFQSLDFTGMIGITGAGIYGQFMHMCNGANLAYEKTAFYEVGGFDGIDHLASGDDMMLLQKIANLYPNKIGFVKNYEASTFTTPKHTLNGFLQQRIRWATKSTSYSEKSMVLTLSLTGFTVGFIPLSLVLGLFINPIFLYAFLIQLLIKSIVDFFFLRMTSRFFHREDLMKSYFMAQPMHIAYIVFVGLAGAFIKEYTWKGRIVK